MPWQDDPVVEDGGAPPIRGVQPGWQQDPLADPQPQEPPEQAAQPVPPVSSVVPESVTAGAGGVLSGVPILGPALYGLGERAAAGYQSLRYGAPYDKALQAIQSQDPAMQARHPVATTVGKVGGGVIGTAPLVAAAPAAFGAGGGGLLARSAASAGSNAAINAGDAYVRGEDPAKAAIYGGLFGLAAPGVAQSVGTGVRGILGKVPVAPTMKQTERLAKTLYRQADRAGVAIDPNSFQGRVNTIAGTVQRAGIDPTLHPGATAALGRLQKAAATGVPLRLDEIDTLRKVVGAAGQSINRDERRVAGIMIDQVDDYLDNLRPQDVVAGQGNVKTATEALTKARAQWHTLRKSEIIANIQSDAELYAANHTQAGVETGLRQGFRQLAKNKKLIRSFTPDEVQAIRNVAMGGPVENAARWLGKFAPHGIVSTGIGGSLGWSIAEKLGIPGEAGAAALLAAGAGGKAAATAMTKRNAALADALVRSGGKLPPSPTTNASERLTQLLMLGATPEAPLKPPIRGIQP